MTQTLPPRRQPPADLELRAARPQDAENLAALMNLPGVRWGTAQLPFQTPEQIRSRLETIAADDRLLLASVGTDLAGSASLQRLRGRRAHVGGIGMSVHDAWTGQGIGTALMAALIDLADNWLGLRRLQLEVNVDNAPAVALYRRFGFELEGTLRGVMLRDGDFIDCHSMGRVRR